MLPPFFFFPFLNISFPNDKEFAESLCDKEKNAISEFAELYSDEMYYIAAKFNNGGIPEEFWTYRTKKGHNINVSDDVSDCYVWLIRIVENRSCEYEGYNGATFKTFIMSYLNNSNRKTDWIRHQTGITNYIPKCIRGLEQTQQDVFKMLQQNKTDTQIQRKLNLNNFDYYSNYAKVEESLLDAGEIGLLSKPKFISIDTLTDNEADKKPIQFKSMMFVDPENIPDIELVKKMLKKTLDMLSDAEKRLIILYWGNRQSVDQIYDTFLIFPDYLDELGIVNSKDIYPVINKLVKKLFKNISDIFPDEVENYKLSPRELKLLIKQYLHYFNDFE
jgi:DNA-directed RNA polymerase specialized sigma subunit